MLDNTLVFWCNELSRGNTLSPDMPFVLAGGRALKTTAGLVYPKTANVAQQPARVDHERDGLPTPQSQSRPLHGPLPSLL